MFFLGGDAYELDLFKSGSGIFWIGFFCRKQVGEMVGENKKASNDISLDAYVYW